MTMKINFNGCIHINGSCEEEIFEKFYEIFDYLEDWEDVEDVRVSMDDVDVLDEE